MVVNVYRYFYRFSMEKINCFVNHPYFMVILLDYLKVTKMSRIYQRDVLIKNLNNYYRAVENMINVSCFRERLILVIKE